MKLEANTQISERAAAKILGVHPSTLLLWRNAGLIPFEYETKIYARGNVRIFYEEAKIIGWALDLKINQA